MFQELEADDEEEVPPPPAPREMIHREINLLEARRRERIEEWEGEEEEQVELPPPPPEQAFKLPDEIRQKIGIFESIFIEVGIDCARHLTATERRPFPGIEFLQEVADLAHEEGRRQAVDKAEEFEGVTEEELRIYVWNYFREHEQEAIGEDADRDMEPRREPESLTLHLPRLGHNNWRKWKQEDVMSWAKKFITKQCLLDLIEYKQFTGRSLRRFLDTEFDYKRDQVPFGLYITLKCNLNRVINNRSGLRFQEY